MLFTGMVQNTTVSCEAADWMFPQAATSTWTRLQPIASTVQHDLQHLCAPILSSLRPQFTQATNWIDTQLVDLQPWQVAVLAVGSTWLALTLYKWVSNVVTDIRDVGKTLSTRRVLILIAECCYSDVVHSHHTRNGFGIPSCL